MVRKIYRILIALTVVCCHTACNESFDVPTSLAPDSPGTITITFISSGMSRSVNSDKSEELVENLYIGLYPLDASDTDAATFWAPFEYIEDHPNVIQKDGKTYVTLQLNDAMSSVLFDNINGKECRIFAVANVPEDVHVPNKASIQTLKSMSVISNFDNGEVQPSFIMTCGTDINNDKIKYSAPTVQGQKGKAAGTLNLKRTAAKIRLNVTVPEKIEIKDDAGHVKETWHPRKTDDKVNMNVALINGVKQATAVAAEKPVNDEAYFDSDLSELSPNGGGYVLDIPFYTYPNSWTESINETRKTILSLTVPWYKDGADSNSTSTFYYQVPLTPAEVTKLESNHSYIVNLTVGMLGSLVPDTPVTVEDVSYQIVNWGDGEVEVPIEDSRYLVVNPNVYTFNNETNMSIPYYTSHPVEIVDVKIKYQRFNFISDVTNPDVGRVVEFTIDEDQIENTNEKYPETPIYTDSKTETLGQKYLNIIHPLNLWTPCDKDDAEVSLIEHTSLADTIAVANSIKYYKPETDDAFSMYTITFTVRHEDRPEYKEDVVIYQYPAIYIEADRNPASKPEGNIFVNGYTNLRSVNNSSNENWKGSQSYGSTTGLTWEDAKNKNPNMYIINITSLSEDIKFSVYDEDTKVTTEYNYVIGDPRSKFCQNLFNTTTFTSTREELVDGETVEKTYTGYVNLKTRTNNSDPAAVSRCNKVVPLYPNDTERTLTYYYVTLEDGSVTNMISPQFRIASSWGVTSGISRFQARYRAALYQENKFPAGRWRIPTVAEFSYINKLSNDRKIPQLFTYNTPYWTSDGLYRCTKEGQISRMKEQADYRAVRAVYDDWYWSQYPQYKITPDANGDYTYTLGDVLRGAQ